MERIYLDNAATTPIKKEVIEAMLPYITEYYGNPSSIYQIAQLNKKAIDEAREEIANQIGAKANEIYFTGGGTESDNWAIKGIADSMSEKGNHIITSKIEHHAVLHTCSYLEKKGYEVTYLDVDENGVISLEQLKQSIKESTILITIMYANNEIGSIMPIKEIGKIARENNIYFHTDAVQAIGQIRLNVEDENIDLLSLTAHKINGPKGIGALYIKRGVRINSILHGGAQERGKRGGTENVSGIVGFAVAIKLAYTNFEQKISQLKELRDEFIKEILRNIPYSYLNGHLVNRLPNNINVRFDFIEGESLLLLLDMQGICASSGSACTSGSLDPSHVLMAIGLNEEKTSGAIRFTIGECTTKENLVKVCTILKKTILKMREMSPLYEEFLRLNK